MELLRDFKSFRPFEYSQVLNIVWSHPFPVTIATTICCSGKNGAKFKCEMQLSIEVRTSHFQFKRITNP
jgi:hypothetical protein